MPRLRDKTMQPKWLDEQVDRLAGFEVLQRCLFPNPEPVSPQRLSDKLGVYRGYSYALVEKVASRLQPL